MSRSARRRIVSILVFFCCLILATSSYAEVSNQSMIGYRRLLLLAGSVNYQAGCLLDELTNPLKKKENIDILFDKVIDMQKTHGELIEKCQNYDVPQNFRKVHSINMKSLKLDYKGFVALESALRNNSNEHMELAFEYFNQSQDLFADFQIAVDEAFENEIMNSEEKGVRVILEK